MKYLGVVIIVAVCSGGRLARPADLDPAQLLVEAANHGRDDPAIRNGSGEVDEELDLAAGTPDEYTRLIEREVASLRARLPQQTDPKQKAALEETIASAAQTARDSVSRDRTYRSHWRVAFDGNRPMGQLRRELRFPSHAPPLVTLGLRENSGAFLTLQQTNSQLNLQVTPRVAIRGEPFWEIPWFPDFGREIADRGNFISAGSLATETNASRFLRRETIDGHELSVIEAVSSLGTKRTLWIDPARGFICPRGESYDAAGRLLRKHEASGFFRDASSGVWFAERHVKTEFDPNDGKQMRRARWHLEPQSLRINAPLGAEEFWLPVRASTLVADERPDGRHWRADADTVLKLVDGQLDLDETPGLALTGSPRMPWERFPKKFTPVVKWIVTAVAGIVTLGLAALVWFLKLAITRTRLLD